MNFYLISTLLIAVSSIFALTRQFQMLQQNSYYPSRYLGWIGTSYINNLLLSSALYLISSMFYLFELYIVQLVFIAVLTIVRFILSITSQKKSIKPIVLTGRVKRLYGSVIILLTALSTVYVLNADNVFGRYFSVSIFLLSFFTPVLTLLCWCLTLPIEKLISAWYIHDAKKVLKNHKGMTVIGVTGSYGKTTTKFILTRILSEKFNVVCTPHSFNTPMGVVRTIREMLLPQTQIFVCEMGAKEVGNIKEVCDIANPHHAIITSVGPQHLDTFKSIENVFKTKFELADAVKKNDGLIFVNGDSKEIIDRIDGDYKIYGTNKDFEYFAENISYGRYGSEFDITLGEEKIHLTTKLLGLHSIIDIVGAVALAYNLGVSANDIKYAVASLKPAEHRLEMKSFTNNSILIDDAYNSNPEGCLEAVRVLGSFDNMKKVIVTPGLVELGEKEYECNYALGKEATENCDVIILVGKNRSKPMQDAVNDSKFNKENLHIVASFKEAMEIYSSFADNNTVVLFENDLPDNYLY